MRGEGEREREREGRREEGEVNFQHTYMHACTHHNSIEVLIHPDTEVINSITTVRQHWICLRCVKA